VSHPKFTLHTNKVKIKGWFLMFAPQP